jgi:phage-related protein
MGFTLGGKTAAELGVELITSDTALKGNAPTRDYFMPTPGRHGIYDYGADLGPLPIVLDCLVVTPTLWKTVIRELNTHLHDGWGHPRVLPLVFDEEPTKTYYVRYSGSSDLGKFMRPNFQRFTLPLIATEPYAFGDEALVEYTVTASPSDLWYVVESGLNVPLTIILDNEGANTINGFSFKTFDEIFDWSYHD